MSLNQRVIIALPKGRVYDQAKELLGRAGIAIPESENGSRKLVSAGSSSRRRRVCRSPSATFSGLRQNTLGRRNISSAPGTSTSTL